MRRKGSKLGLSSVRTLEWLEDTEDVTTKHVQELSKRRKSKHSRTESVGYGLSIKTLRSFPELTIQQNICSNIAFPIRTTFDT